MKNPDIISTLDWLQSAQREFKDCKVCIDENGKSYIKVPCESIFSSACVINTALDHAIGYIETVQLLFGCKK